MTKLLIDLKLKDEGPIHQFMKKMIWYNIKNKEEGLNFSCENFIYHNNYIKLKKEDAWLEKPINLNGYYIKPDITVFDKNGNIETVIECIHTSRPNIDKYKCYMNSDINLIFIDSDIKINQLSHGYMRCNFMLKKGIDMSERFKILLKNFSKLDSEFGSSFRLIGKFEEDNSDNYFLFKKTEKYGGVNFFNSTSYSYGKFSRSNSKKIPILLKEYLERFNKKDNFFSMTFKSQLPFSEYEWRRGIKSFETKTIRYWELD